MPDPSSPFARTTNEPYACYHCSADADCEYPTCVQPPNSNAETAPAASTSLDPAETTVEVDADAALTAEGVCGVELRHPFRHSGWAGERQKVIDAMRFLDLPAQRIGRFLRCGTGGHLLKHATEPDHYRIVGNNCRDRFCVPCQLDRAHTIRQNLIPLMKGSQHRFITLTLGGNRDDLQVLVDRLISCFRRLRETHLWQSRIRGGVAFLEIKWSTRSHNWHPHLHVLTHGCFISQDALSRVWARITGDSYIVDIRFVRNIEDAAGHVAKYATKRIATDVIRNPEALREAIMVMQGRRLLLPFGDWYQSRLTSRADDDQWEYVCDLASIYIERNQGNADAAKAIEQLETRFGRFITKQARPPP